MGKKRGHGEAEYKTLPSGRVWWRVRVTYPDGTAARPSGTAKNMTAARAAVEAKKAEAAVGQRPVSRTLTVGKMIREHIDSKRAIWKPGYTARNEYLLERYILPRLGHLTAAGLTPAALRAHYEHLEGAGLHGSGQRQVRALLSGAYKRSIMDGVLRENPTVHASPVKEKASAARVKSFTPDEARAFLAAALEDRWALVLAFMLLTGLRLGEAVGLYWEDVSPDDQTPPLEDGTTGAVWVQVSKTRSEFRGQFFEDDPKTAAGRRVVWVSGVGLDILDRMRENVKIEAEGHGGGVGPYIFPSVSGKPLLHSTARKAMRRTCLRAGVPLLSPHKLRHSFATLGHAGGWNVAALSKQLGHAQTSTTLNIYRHDFEGERRGMMLDLSPAKAKADPDVPKE